MKRLVGGASIIVPNARVIPRFSHSLWPTHGDLNFVNIGTDGMGNYFFIFTWTLKSGVENDYTYGPYSLAQLGLLNQAFSFDIPLNRLTRGETYNVQIRPNLYAINGFPF